MRALIVLTLPITLAALAALAHIAPPSLASTPSTVAAAVSAIHLLATLTLSATRLVWREGVGHAVQKVAVGEASALSSPLLP